MGAQGLMIGVENINRILVEEGEGQVQSSNMKCN